MTSCKHPSQDSNGKNIRCLDCRAYLSLGPANDTLEVTVEIEAAELAARCSLYGLPDDVSFRTRDGWNLNHIMTLNGEPNEWIVKGDGEVGWLAREIWSAS